MTDPGPCVVLRLDGSKHEVDQPEARAWFDPVALEKLQRGRPRKSVKRAAFALAGLSPDQIEALADLACLEGEDSPERKLARIKILEACTALARLDPGMLAPVVDYARRVAAGARPR